MSAKTKMKDYVAKMFSTKESTSSTEGLLSSQVSGLSAASTSVAPLLLHSLPIRPTNNYRVYQPTTVTIHRSTRYEKVPRGDTRGYEHSYTHANWKNTIKSLKMSKDGQLSHNIRQVYDDRQELDDKSPSIQENESQQTGKDVSSTFMPQVLAALSVSMGSLTVGFASAYTSPASVTMSDGNVTSFPITESEISLIGGILPLSALVGGLVGGPLIDVLGRKRTILGTAIPFLISWLFIAFATNVPLILVGRSLAGLCTGIASLSLPVYLGETVQPEVRGTLGLLPTAFGNTGILIAYTAGMFLNWWNLAYLGSLIPIPYLILMWIIPETPCWYLSKGRKEEAREALQWLRGEKADIQKEFSEVENNALKNQKGGSTLSSLFTKSNMKPIAITIGLMFFQQLSGVNAVIFYTVDIFRGTGSKLDENLCTIIVGLVNFASTFLATCLIDRMGRKMLLYISCITMVITLGALTAYMYLKEVLGWDVEAYGYIPLLSFVFYIIGFSLGFGPIPWLMMGELLPSKIRGPAASLATAFNWTCTTVVTSTFRGLISEIGSAYTFGLFGTVCFVGFFFVLFFVPETRGKSLEDIEMKFKKQTRRMSSIANLRPTPMSV